jgi:hypothetical protein
VETYERGHGNRPAALDKLRYMRDTEPLPRKRRSFVKVTRTEPIPDTKNRWVGIP